MTTHFRGVNRFGRVAYGSSRLTPAALLAHLTRLGWVDVEIVTPERQAS